MDLHETLLEEFGLNVYKTEDGEYKWRMESTATYSTPVKAMRAALDLIEYDGGRRQSQTTNLIPFENGMITATTKFEWEPIIPLK